MEHINDNHCSWNSNKQQINYDVHLNTLDRNRVSIGNEVTHADEWLPPPPPYSSLLGNDASDNSDWKDMFIEIQPLNNCQDKYGFAISGGIDSIEHVPIIITHIQYCSSSSFDNGRTRLRLFDRICSVNGIDMTHVRHDEAAQIFSSMERQTILLHIRRLDPTHVEHVELFIGSHRSNEPLGITLTGGLGNNVDDSGLFITHIDRDGLLASLTNNNQIRMNDRLLEIKTNSIRVDLRSITRAKASRWIRRICNDDARVTLVVAHRTA
jgi:hypothetical protein